MSSPARLSKLRDRIVDQLDEMTQLASDRSALEHRSDRVSKWTVGEHVRHLILAHGSVLDLLEKAEPKADLAGQGPTMVGRCVLALGFIPRGRGKAPAAVEPLDPKVESLAADLGAIHGRFAALDLGPLVTAQPLSRHFVFGALDARQWLRFVTVHQHHHAKIIRDIRDIRCAGSES